MAAAAGQRYLAEFLGTFGLLLAVGGAAVFSFPPVSPEARVIQVSLAVGFAVAGLIYAFGDVSGGHFNPAVTLSLALSGRMPRRDVVPYIVMQVLGGVLGMAVILGIDAGWSTGLSNAQSSALASQCYSGFGAPTGCHYAWYSVFLVELALTFVFVLVIQLVTRPNNTARNLAPMAIGVLLAVTNLVAIPVDGASINPARSFAPALVSVIWPSARWAIVQVWIFWVAPILGGLLASGVERALSDAPTMGTPH
jgi:aquaporin Z